MEETKNTEQEATRFPLDFDALNKGDYINPEKLIEITGAELGSKRYNFGVLRIVKQMREYLFSKGLVWTIKVEKDGIKICTDEEASEYNPPQYEFARKRMKRLYAQNAAVDVSKLTDDQQQAHLRRLQIQGMEITGLQKSRIDALRSMRQIETQ